MAVLHDLAPELVDAILLFVSPCQLLNIRLCSRWFNDYISRSSLTQYRIECWATGVYEDLLPGISFPERLAAVRRRQQAWHTLDVRKHVEIGIPALSSGIYDFTGGILALLDVNVRPIGYATLKLPSMLEEAGSWKHVRPPNSILEYAFAVEAHDLSAILTLKGARVDPPQSDADGTTIWALSFDLHLRSVSEGDAHPAAQQPVVCVCDQFLAAKRPGSFVHVMGEYVLVMLMRQDWPPLAAFDADVLYSVQWRTGIVHELARFTPQMYLGFVFLRADMILSCNLNTKTLDVYVINHSADTAQPTSLTFFCSLLLPFPGKIRSYQCRAEPNVHFPFPKGQASGPTLDYQLRDDPDCALVYFKFTYIGRQAATLVVHRDRLLAAAIERSGQFAVAYEGWVPDICSWLDGNTGGYITQSYAQRVVLTTPVPNPGVGHIIHVYDFNPRTVRRTRQELEHDIDDVLPHGNHVTLTLCEGSSMHMPLSSAPDKRLESRLPYVKTTMRDPVDYSDVMLDGERILCFYPRGGEDSKLTLAEVMVISY
ncbi:hypothetical protein PENSPDRAFT_751676 [Peniophora sp. CONT]|nr:hypothetical protein PENSPDRAFT_751676 [Peniophora sp. CONT]